jgi:hypothetical protein
LIKNLGSSFVYLVFYFILLILYLLASLLSRVIPFLKRPVSYLSRHLFWNLTISLFMSQYPPIIMATIINLYDFQFSNAVERASTALCLGLSIMMPIGLVITFYAIDKFRKLKIIGTEEYQERYSMLTMERDESER